MQKGMWVSMHCHIIWRHQSIVLSRVLQLLIRDLHLPSFLSKMGKSNLTLGIQLCLVPTTLLCNVMALCSTFSTVTGEIIFAMTPMMLSSLFVVHLAFSPLLPSWLLLSAAWPWWWWWWWWWWCWWRNPAGSGLLSLRTLNVDQNNELEGGEGWGSCSILSSITTQRAERFFLSSFSSSSTQNEGHRSTGWTSSKKTFVRESFLITANKRVLNISHLIHSEGGWRLNRSRIYWFGLHATEQPGKESKTRSSGANFCANNRPINMLTGEPPGDPSTALTQSRSSHREVSM